MADLRPMAPQQGGLLGGLTFQDPIFNGLTPSPTAAAPSSSTGAGPLSGLATDGKAEGTNYDNDTFLQGLEVSQGDVRRQIQNATGEIDRQMQSALAAAGQLPGQYAGLFDATRGDIQRNTGNLAAAQAGRGVGSYQSADAQMAPILSALSMQRAGFEGSVPLLQAGIRENALRQKGALAMRGDELLSELRLQALEHQSSRENKLTDELATYKGKLLIDKELGIGDFAESKKTDPVKYQAQSYLSGLNPSVASADRGGFLQYLDDPADPNDAYSQAAGILAGVEKQKSKLSEKDFQKYIEEISKSEILDPAARSLIMYRYGPGDAAVNFNNFLTGLLVGGA